MILEFSKGTLSLISTDFYLDLDGFENPCPRLFHIKKNLINSHKRVQGSLRITAFYILASEWKRKENEWIMHLQTCVIQLLDKCGLVL